MKKIMAVVLCLMLVLSMTACADTGDKAKLIGTWTCQMDLSEQINMALGADPEMAEYIQIEDFVISLDMTFREDDTFEIVTDEAALEASMEKLMEGLAEDMAAYLEAVVKEESGMEMAADDILALSGMTMDQLLEDAFSKGMVQEMASEMNREGKFKAKDGKLHTSAGVNYEVDPEVYETYTLEGDTLTILEYVGSPEGVDEDAAAIVSSVYPMVFHKAG